MAAKAASDFLAVNLGARILGYQRWRRWTGPFGYEGGGGFLAIFALILGGFVLGLAFGISLNR